MHSRLFAVAVLCCASGFAQITITSLSPQNTVAGAPTFTLVVNGVGFLGTNNVQWDGATIPTTFVSFNQLNATVTAAQIAAVGTHNVRVRLSIAVPIFSNTVVFAVLSATPTLSSVSPNATTAGGTGITIAATGADFADGATVRWDGANLPTTYASTTSLTAFVSAALLANGGAHTITVKNPTTAGGTSGSVAFTTNNPVPGIGALMPGSAVLGSSPVLTIAGSNFVPSSIFVLGGVSCTTTILSSTSLTAAAPASVMSAAGSYSVQVVNPAPGGGTATVGAVFLVTNPTPGLSGISPQTVVAGNPAFTLTVSGSDYVAASVVRIDGVNQSTTFVSSTQLTANVAAATIASPGPHSVAVFTVAPGGGTSPSTTLFVNNPAPLAASVTPSAVLVGSGGVTVTVNGSGFVPASTVQIGFMPLVTTFVSATQVMALVPASITAGTGVYDLHVQNPNPGGGASNTVALSVNNPAALITTTSPPFFLSDAGATPCVLIGTGFLPSTTVTVDGAPLATAFVSATQLSATMPADVTSIAGFHFVAATNPGPGGGNGNTVSVIVNNPTPTLASLSPSTLNVDTGPQNVTVAGTHFVPGIFVHVAGAPVPTSFVSPTEVIATVPASVTAAPGIYGLGVQTPPPGVVGSGTLLSLSVVHAFPTIGSSSPPSLPVGSPTAILTLNGSGFDSASVAAFDGVPLTTTFVSPTALTAVLPAALLGIAASYSVTINNPAPGGGLSSGLPFDVTNPTAITASISPTLVPVGATDTTVTVDGSGFIQSSIVSTTGFGFLPTTFVNSGRLTAVVPASTLATAGPLDVGVVNPGPGGGTSNFIVLNRFNAVPTILGASGVPTPAVGQTSTLTVAGSDFVPTSVVRLDGVDLATTTNGTFPAIASLTAQIPLGLVVAAGAHALTVFNPGQGGGSSAPFALTINYPTPVVLSQSPSVFLGGGSDTVFTIDGSGFLPETTVVADGLPLVKSASNPTQIECVFPKGLAVAVGAVDIVVSNPAPGGGFAVSAVTVAGGTIASVTPATIPVLGPGSAPITLTLNGNFNLIPGAIAHVNGAPVPTSFVALNTYTCQIGPTVAASLSPGGFALTLVKFTANSAIASNAVGIAVGTAGAFDNAGTVSVLPHAPLAGESFMVRVEAPAENVPVTLLIDLGPLPPFAVPFAPGFDLQIGVLQGPTLALADGLGLLGPPNGATLAANDLAGAVPGPRGTLDFYGFVAPPVPFGFTMSLQAIFVDVSSPVFANLTWINFPQTL